MKVKLNNVRLSYPNLWKARAAQEGAEAKFSASLIMDKVQNAADIKAVQDAIQKVCDEQWPKGIPKGVKVCLRDGSEKDNDGYGPTIMFISASNAIRVPVVDKDPSVALTAEDGRPYAGCHVNAMIRLWAQDNNYGKRVNAQLQGIQFWGEGEAFGDKPADAMEMFGDGRKSEGAQMFGAPEAADAGEDDFADTEARDALISKVKAEPEWNKLLDTKTINSFLNKKYGAPLMKLTPQQAKDALKPTNYAEMIKDCVEPPF